MSTESTDTKAHLQALRARNAELENRLLKLQALSSNLDNNKDKITTMYEELIITEESRCRDMVDFDSESKTLQKLLFPTDLPKTVKPRKREETSDIIMSQMFALQQLNPQQSEEYLLSVDPQLSRLRQETQQMLKFLAKYQSLL